MIKQRNDLCGNENEKKPKNVHNTISFFFVILFEDLFFLLLLLHKKKGEIHKTQIDWDTTIMLTEKGREQLDPVGKRGTAALIGKINLLGLCVVVRCR